MKKSLDWKAFGQFFSSLLSLFTIVRDTLASMKVGIEIIPWILSEEGKKHFTENFLVPLSNAYLSAQRVRIIGPACIEVNLDASPNLPFEGAMVEVNEGGGWVKVERRKDELYVNGKKVVLRLAPAQQDGRDIGGHAIREELSGRGALHPNILDALIEHTYLIPESWKTNEQGHIRLIYFFGVVYRSADGGLCVRYLCFHVGGGALDGWGQNFRWLGLAWGARCFAALLESRPSPCAEPGGWQGHWGPRLDSDLLPS